jgi:alkylation response protein AidB-like acyl-CoA dehydrogenase
MAHHTLTGTYTEEQDELRKVVRSFLSKHSTEADVRDLMATTRGYDPAQWRRMGAELGLQGLGVPE